jgi:hypothetical protein
LEVSGSAVDDIQRLMNAGHKSRLERVTIDGITAGAALELACRAWFWMGDAQGTAFDRFDAWRSQSATLRAVWDDLIDANADSPLDLRPVPYEHLYLAPASVLGHRWDSFFKRFELSMRHQSFSSAKAAALAASMREMAENVWNHSGPDDESPAPGIMAYHVTAGAVEYAVADVGRGVLQSMQSENAWPGITTPRDALEAAVQLHRSRRKDHPQGDGFARVLRSLADLGGVLRFRSGDSVLTITGKEEERRFEYRASPDLAGLQLTIRCSPGGPPSEKFLG